MEAVTQFSVRIVQRYLPSAFVLAVMLTAIVFVLGMALGGETPMAMAGYWGDGFSSLFTFGMQMVLVLLTGYVLALTPLMQSVLSGLTRRASTPRQALGADYRRQLRLLLPQLGLRHGRQGRFSRARWGAGWRFTFH